MRKACALFLLLLYLLTNTEMHQFVRLPILLDHYQEHRALKNDISFLEYLSLHYFTYDEHNHNHQDLPFKHGHCTVIHMVLAVVPNVTPADFNAEEPVHNENISPEPQFHFSSLLASIWQPPKRLR